MYFGEALVEEIRSQNDIVDVISEYVSLTKKGNSYFGRCPFHNENTPSFSVRADKQYYHCFGCGASGNVYSFIMQIDNTNFVEAVKKLAERARIEIPDQSFSEQAKNILAEKQKLIELHKKAGRFFYSQLQSKNGEEARDYLNNIRKMAHPIQIKFGIGYAGYRRDTLYTYFKTEGYDDSIIEKSGLCIKNKEKGFYDRFVNRIMFPIFDVTGKVIAFGGRAMKNVEPKYLNSPETVLFNKSQNLYNLHNARQEKGTELIIVEGYMDAIALYQAGIKNAAATMGTAFNNEHAKLIAKYYKQVIFLFDGDSAGQTAVQRAIPVALKKGFSIKICTLTDAKDPDEFIKKKGADEFRKVLAQSKNYISFQIDCIRNRFNMQNTDEKVNFTKEAAKIFADVDNEIEQDAYIKETEQFTGISYSAIKNEVQKFLQRNELSGTIKKASVNQINQTSHISNDLISKKAAEAQKMILNLLATDKRLYQIIKRYLTSEEFIDDTYKKLAEILYALNGEGKDIYPAEIISYFESIQEHKKVTDIFNIEMTFDDKRNMELAVNDAVKCLKEMYYAVEMDKAVTDLEKYNRLFYEKSKLKHINIFE